MADFGRIGAEKIEAFAVPPAKGSLSTHNTEIFGVPPGKGIFAALVAETFIKVPPPILVYSDPSRVIKNIKRLNTTKENWTITSPEKITLAKLGTPQDPGSRLNGTITEDTDGTITVPIKSGWTGLDPSSSIWFSFPIKTICSGRMVSEAGGLGTFLSRISYRLKLITPLPTTTDLAIIVFTATNTGMVAGANRQIGQGIRLGIGSTPSGCTFTNSPGLWQSSFGSSSSSIMGAELHHIVHDQDAFFCREGLLDSNENILSGFRFGAVTSPGGIGAYGGSAQHYCNVSFLLLTDPGPSPANDFEIKFQLWAFPAIITNHKETP